MKIASLAGILSIFLVVVMSALAADDMSIERLATCQDSWLEWKDEPAQLKKIAGSIRSSFSQKDGAPFLVPKTEVTVVGLPVVQLYPESIGMAVGFSVMVDADFNKTRASLEKKIGKLFRKCETGDNMLACDLEIAEKKTLLLMGDEKGKSRTTLFGCYYYYEK